MFERYTEPARRLIFFARYEAAQLGGAAIDTEHLLPGLLREGVGGDERWSVTFFADGKTTAEVSARFRSARRRLAGGPAGTAGARVIAR